MGDHGGALGVPLLGSLLLLLDPQHLLQRLHLDGHHRLILGGGLLDDHIHLGGAAGDEEDGWVVDVAVPLDPPRAPVGEVATWALKGPWVLGE